MCDENELKSILQPGLSVQEAIELLLGDDDEFFDREIVIAPPEPNVLSDEDSGDEDTCTMDNLSQRQLLADAEVRINRSNEITDEPDCFTIQPSTSEQFSPTSFDVQPSTSKQFAGSSIRGDRIREVISRQKSKLLTKSIKIGRVEKKKKKVEAWLKGDLVDMSRKFPLADYSFYEGLTPVQIFELIIDDQIVNLITTESNRYANQNNYGFPEFLEDEIRCFLGIMYFSSYHQVPSKRLYWQKNSDTYIPIVANSMRRRRFEDILRCFHVANNESFSPEIVDKLWKIRPLIDLLKAKFSQHFIPEQNLSYDESMVRYFGRHGLKQFIPTKPIRFGFKAWSLNAPSGYLLDFEIYQGRSTQDRSLNEILFGKCAAPLLQMIDNFTPDQKFLPFHFFVDNLFTSLNLFSHLRELGYGATGTVRENRIPKSCPLSSKQSLKKTPRGHIESLISKEHGVIVCKWVDNSVVSVCSNTYGVAPITTVSRYSFAQKKAVDVPRPAILTEYNKGMGGTDRTDQNVNLYRIHIRNRKWYWPLIAWLLNVALQNAWIIYKKAGNNIPQLDFRRTIVTSYLNKYCTPRKSSGRANTKLQTEVRYDRLDHLILTIPDGKRRRCAHENCSTASRYICSKCDVGLHADCFAAYHIK